MGYGRLFAYLDAHWGEDLPLAEKLEIVFSWDSDAIVMIDDFQVPDDPGYAYDDYGPGKALTPDLVDPACRRLGNNTRGVDRSVEDLLVATVTARICFAYTVFDVQMIRSSRIVMIERFDFLWIKFGVLHRVSRRGQRGIPAWIGPGRAWRSGQ